MNIIKALTLTLCAILASTAYAGFRLESGKVLIQAGDPVAKIHRYLKPAKSYKGKVCASPSAMPCRGKDSASGKIYEYRANNVTYIVQTHGGTITYIAWEY